MIQITEFLLVLMNFSRKDGGLDLTICNRWNAFNTFKFF